MSQFSILTGWACDCGSGSDYSSGQLVTRESLAAGEGRVLRWHDFTEKDFTASTKDLQTLQDFISQGSAGFGLLVPQAEGADQPGSLAANVEPHIYIMWDEGADTVYLSVPLTPSQELADQLTTLMPPPANTRWQALALVPGNWQFQLPSQTTNLQNIWGSLHYGLDFQGSDSCNHCEVKLTACSNAPLTNPQRAALRLFGADQVLANDEVACALPVSTLIMLDEPLPGPVVASFGPFGGVVYTSTMQSALTIPYSLRHTSQVTQTLTLAAVASSQGWDYTWQDLAGNPITQIEVGPIGDDLWASYADNLQIKVDDLPACVHLRDTIYLTATLATTPTIQALATTLVDVLPDPAVCTVVDLGISQSVSLQEIEAGGWLTATLTITNFEATSQDAVITQTLSASAAVSDVILPAGCSRNTDQIVCILDNLAGGDSATLTFMLQAAPTFSGKFTLSTEVQPAAGADLRYYDNYSGLASITVYGGAAPQVKVYLPLIRRP